MCSEVVTHLQQKMKTKMTTEEISTDKGNCCCKFYKNTHGKKGPQSSRIFPDVT